MPKRDYLRFQAGIPEKIALAFPQGIRKEGVYGPQMFFSLVDGRGMYLDEPVAQKIANAGIEPGQTFWLVKHKAKGSGKHSRTIWDLYLEDPTPQAGESTLERDLRHSIDQAQRVTALSGSPDASRNNEPAQREAPDAALQTSAMATPRKQILQAKESQPGWAETLVQQTNSLVDAYAECLNHANQHGVVVRPDDVRTLLVTSFIGLSQRRGRNAA